MSSGRASEFFFVGAAILPGFLLYAGDPGLAAIAFVALIVAGAICGIADPRAPHRTVKRREDGAD